MLELNQIVALNESWGEAPAEAVAPDLAAEPYLVAVVGDDESAPHYVHPAQRSIVYDPAQSRGFATAAEAAFWAHNNRDRLGLRPGQFITAFARRFAPKRLISRTLPFVDGDPEGCTIASTPRLDSSPLRGPACVWNS